MIEFEQFKSELNTKEEPLKQLEQAQEKKNCRAGQNDGRAGFLGGCGKGK